MNGCTIDGKKNHFYVYILHVERVTVGSRVDICCTWCTLCFAYMVATLRDISHCFVRALTGASAFWSRPPVDLNDITCEVTSGWLYFSDRKPAEDRCPAFIYSLWHTIYSHLATAVRIKLHFELNAV